MHDTTRTQASFDAFADATRSDASDEREYSVPLEYTQCNFGSVRPWLRCPGVVDGVTCSRRVGKFYCPPRGDYYLCRECYDLGYRSSRTLGKEWKQAEVRYRRAFAKADAKNRRPHPNGEPYNPERPTGMHHDTYKELLEEDEAAREEWDRTHRAELQKMASRTGV